MNDVDDSRRQVRLRHQLAELHGVVRRLLAWFDHDRVACDQRGCRFARDQEEGKVPGQDAADDADRLPEKQDGFAGPVALQNLAFDAARPLRHVVHVVGGEGDFHARQAERLALLLGNQAGERFHLLSNFGRDRAQRLCALDGGALAPGFLRRDGRRDRRFHVGGGAFRHRADGLASRRIQTGNALGAGGWRKLAVDEIVVVQHGFPSIQQAPRPAAAYRVQIGRKENTNGFSGRRLLLRRLALQ